MCGVRECAAGRVRSEETRDEGRGRGDRGGSRIGIEERGRRGLGLGRDYCVRVGLGAERRGAVRRAP